MTKLYSFGKTVRRSERSWNSTGGRLKARKATDIPVQEAACAANYLARSQYGMPYESLIVETAKALGLTRVPVDSDNYKLGRRAVDYCIRQQLLMLDDDGFVKGVL